MPEEEYTEDCCGATVIPGFEKIKVWDAMCYGKLSELVILPDLTSNTEGKKSKFNVEKYRELIMKGEMYNFWVEAYEECE